MQVVEVFTVDEEVEHVVTLTANLESHFHPVQFCGLKEFGSFKRSEQIPTVGINTVRVY